MSPVHVLHAWRVVVHAVSAWTLLSPVNGSQLHMLRAVLAWTVRRDSKGWQPRSGCGITLHRYCIVIFSLSLRAVTVDICMCIDASDTGRTCLHRRHAPDRVTPGTTAPPARHPRNSSRAPLDSFLPKTQQDAWSVLSVRDAHMLVVPCRTRN